MKNYLLTISYDGAAYHGWQVQPNAVTVQEKMQDAVEQILGVREGLIGCSRTDAGVHAKMFCCNMRTQRDLPPEKLQTALNAVLPRDIAVLKCGEVPYDFHARYDCTGKTYTYLILNRTVRDPFYENRAFHYPRHLHAERLQNALQAFVGVHDFSAFCAAGSDTEDRVREIRRAAVHRDGDFLRFEIEGNGFLYHMVRIIVGTVLEMHEGKIPYDAVPEILESRDRKNAGKTAPAHGLYLEKVFYNGEG